MPSFWSVGIVFRGGSRGQAGPGGFPSHAFPFQVDAVGVVDDPVEDGVNDGGFSDRVFRLAGCDDRVAIRFVLLDVRTDMAGSHVLTCNRSVTEELLDA